MKSHTPGLFSGRLGRSNQSAQPRDPPVQQASSDKDYDKISDEEREHIDEVFDLMDMRKKGWLVSYEFKHALAALGCDMSKPDNVRELENYGTVPLNWRGPHSCPVNRLLIYPEQFRQCAAKLIVNRDPREEAIKIFNMFDYDQDGIISVEDMRQLAQVIEEEPPMINEEIEELIEHLDHDGKGGVNVEDFIQMMEGATE